MKNQTMPIACPLHHTALLASALLTLGLSRPAQAQEPGPPAGVQKITAESYRVWVSNPGALPGRLQLVNTTTGALLYEEASFKVSFGRRFDVRNLPDGEYAFVVKLGKEQYRYTLALRTTSQRSAELSANATAARPAASAGL